tara:strand:- start:1010 stop:1378 length:369 start_codon:yes stop_codon:yes gene_type:complete
MFKKLLDRYFKLLKKIDERHYWPLFIFLSCYFVIPYSEFVVTALILLYFKFEAQFRKIGARLIRPFPEWIRIGGSTIFFLVMLDDTLAYLSIIAIAFWSNKELKKREKLEQLEKEEREKGLM